MLNISFLIIQIVISQKSIKYNKLFNLINWRLFQLIKLYQILWIKFYLLIKIS